MAKSIFEALEEIVLTNQRIGAPLDHIADVLMVVYRDDWRKPGNLSFAEPDITHTDDRRRARRRVLIEAMVTLQDNALAILRRHGEGVMPPRRDTIDYWYCEPMTAQQREIVQVAWDAAPRSPAMDALNLPTMKATK